MKKKILIVLIIIISVVSIFVFYKVKQGRQTLEVSKQNDTITKEEQETKDELNKRNITEEKIENTKKGTEEKNDQETKDKISKSIPILKDENINNKQKQEEVNSIEDKKKMQNNNKLSDTLQEEKSDEKIKQEIIDEKVQETIKIDLTKYDRYEENKNGGYIAYVKSESEMNKLKNLIDSCIKEFGYTNVTIKKSKYVPDKQYFTANETNVKNKVYNSEDFTIYYYAEAEYHITSEGKESLFQYRSYIKVQ